MKNTLILFASIFILSYSSSRCQYSTSFSYPLQDNWNVTQDFNVWNGAFNGYHLGEDVVRNIESAVYATADGKVMHVAQHTGYGYVIIIQHQLPDNSYVCSVYGHLRAKDIITSNTDVKKGQLIGYLSSDPNENGGYDFTHLHFGIRSGLYTTDLDSDGKWRYRGYGSTEIVSLWFDPTDFISSRNGDVSNSLNWTRITNMPTPRSWTQAVYYNSKIYVVGGCSSSVYRNFSNEVSTVEVYDVITNTWNTKSSMIQPRVGAAVVEFNGKIYVFGGFNNSYWSANNTAEVYDISSDKWSLLPNMPVGVSWTKATVSNNKIFVLGGVGYNYENVLEVFDPSSNSWSTKTSFSKGRYMHAVTSNNGKIYLIGGNSWASGYESFNDLQVYDITSDTWTTKTSMSSSLDQLEAVAVNNVIWVFSSNGVCRKYSIADDAWTEISSDQDKSSSFSISYAKGSFFRFGGGDWGPTSNVAEKTSITTGIENIEQIPNSFSLSQNYPNPFNPTTTIKYFIPQTSIVNISIYDILGREVTKLVNEEKLPGNYEVNFSGSNLSSGVYLYRMQAGSFSQTKKLILIK